MSTYQYRENDKMPTCSICLTNYTPNTLRPMVLQCGHTFCLQCVQRFQPRQCPSCRTPFRDAAVNFSLIEQMEVIEQMLKQLSTKNATQNASNTKSKEFKEKSPDLYVGRLLYSVDDEQLRAMFAKFGPIRSVKVMRVAATSASRGFGFVNFMREVDAVKAKEQMHGSHLNSQKTLVVDYKEKKPKKTDDAVNAPQTSTSDAVYYFNPNQLRPPNNSDARNETGTYRPNSDYAYPIHGATTTVRTPAQSSMGNGAQATTTPTLSAPHRAIYEGLNSEEPIIYTSGCTLLITNLDPIVCDGVLKMLFEPFGRIESARVINLPSYYGVVRFASASDASFAKSAMHNTVIGNRHIIVYIVQQSITLRPGPPPLSSLFIQSEPCTYRERDSQCNIM